MQLNSLDRMREEEIYSVVKINALSKVQEILAIHACAFTIF